LVGFPTDAAVASVANSTIVSRIPMFATDRSFDPDTLRVLQRVFDEAAAALPSEEQTQERKAILASRILFLASTGETDPVRLRTAALLAVVPGLVSEKHAT
jgi:hypothetical protein